MRLERVVKGKWIAWMRWVDCTDGSRGQNWGVGKVVVSVVSGQISDVLRGATVICIYCVADTQQDQKQVFYPVVF